MLDYINKKSKWKKYLLKTFFPRILTNAIALVYIEPQFYFDENLQLLLIWRLKLSLSSISIPKSFTFDIALICFSISAYNMVSMISLAFIGDCHLRFAWNHNHVITLKQFYAVSLSDSRLLIEFSAILAKLENVLSSANLWIKANNKKYEISLENMLNRPYNWFYQLQDNGGSSRKSSKCPSKAIKF